MQLEALALVTWAMTIRVTAKPKRVHLTMYRGKPLDQDNLVSSAKHVVDGLVDARLI